MSTCQKCKKQFEEICLNFIKVKDKLVLLCDQCKKST